MLEEYEKHIVRPTSTHKQGQQIRERKQQANRKQCNYGDPFASQPAEHDFEISDGSESDDQLEDEGVQYAPHPSQSRKNADATTAFFSTHPQPPGSSRQPFPQPPPPPTYHKHRGLHTHGRLHRHQLRCTKRRLPPLQTPWMTQPPPAPTAHAQQPPFFAPPPPIPTWQIPPPPPPPFSRTSHAPPPPPPPFGTRVQQTPATITTPMAPTGIEWPPEPSAPGHPQMHGAGRDLGAETRAPALAGGGPSERPPPSFADYLRSISSASVPPHSEARPSRPASR
jgi:hypothetical protein